ncbi:ABC transporter permease [Amycolatopsis acidicola]|uniref:ABC transporter permease n=1 Tax=Amycolatopsis acidicola TaxID=2596893 RepID=A0A5N0VI25_9PSEU|nr:ABC transporter permease [Amycolatopsis acidicola]KAA9165815.1 ABC transporter permease [Amycolatopsis acidicola]
MKPRPMWPLAALTALAGAVVAIVLGLVTVGVQATVSPHGLPVAVAVPEAAPAPAHAAAEHVATQGGGALSWRVTTPEDARKLLDDKEVYGILQLGSPVQVVVSGAVNPAGTQVVQQALTTAGQALATATGTTLQTQTVHPASLAGRTAPLAVSILCWLGSLAAGAFFLAAAKRAGRPIGLGARLTRVLTSGVLMTAVIAGFLRLWDSTLPLNWQVLGFVFLVAMAFGSIQGALLRIFGLAAMAVLGPLYLLAPAVAGQVPELLNPAYKNALWSWTPFRFSTEGMRSILQGTPGAPDVTTALWVLGVMLAIGLVVLFWPGRSARQETEPDVADRVVEVGVH